MSSRVLIPVPSRTEFGDGGICYCVIPLFPPPALQIVEKCLRLLSRFLRFAGRILPSATGRVPVRPQMYAMGAPHVRRECRPRYASAFHIRSPLSRRNVSSQLAPKFGGILNPPLPARPRMRGCESIFANSFVRPSPWRLQSDVYHSCSVSRGRAGFPPGASRQQHWNLTWRWHLRQSASAHITHTTDVCDNFWIISRAS